MNGGTYAEALKVGFTHEQAGFFGRMASETRKEAIVDAHKKYREDHDVLEQGKRDRRHAFFQKLVAVALYAVFFLAGSAVGRLV